MVVRGSAWLAAPWTSGMGNSGIEGGGDERMSQRVRCKPHRMTLPPGVNRSTEPAICACDLVREVSTNLDLLHRRPEASGPRSAAARIKAARTGSGWGQLGAVGSAHDEIGRRFSGIPPA